MVRLAHKAPGFAARASAALQGYSRQRAAAQAAVAQLQQERLKWLRRPDVQRVCSHPQPICWKLAWPAPGTKHSALILTAMRTMTTLPQGAIAYSGPAVIWFWDTLLQCLAS